MTITPVNRVNRAERTLTAFQLGWAMCHLRVEFSAREFACGEGKLHHLHWHVGEARRLEGGDWRVTIYGRTERERELMNKFNLLKIGSFGVQPYEQPGRHISVA